MTEAVENCVVPAWLMGLSYQQQSVILLALRGPDGVRKEHPAKQIHTAYRATVLRAAFRGRFLRWGEAAAGFMSLELIAHPSDWSAAIKTFFKHVDALPHHYVSHLAHAAEIIGYRHPDERFRLAWGLFYRAWCDDKHVNPESHDQMNLRLNDWGTAQLRLRQLGFDFFEDTK